MTRIRIVGGKIIEIIGGEYNIYSSGNIVYNSSKTISFTGEENGVIFGEPKDPPILKLEKLKKFCLHFRRPSNYNSEFGFDWLRDEYIYPITNINGVIKELSSDIAKLKSEYLKDVVNKINPHGNEYYPSWISLELNNEAELDIEIEEFEVLESDLTEIIFESCNSNIKITPEKILLSDLISTTKQSKNLGLTNKRDYYLSNKKVKIKYENEVFNEHQEIKAFAKLGSEKREIGKIMVYKNKDIYKLKARFVEVEFKGQINHSMIADGLDIKSNLNFSKDISKVEITNNNLIPPRSQPINSKEKINNWKNYIKNTEEKFKKQFAQALIRYEPVKDVKNKDIEYKSIKIDFKNFTIGTNVGGTGFDKVKKSITSIDPDAISCNMVEFLNGLHEIYELENTPENGIIVFMLPITIRYSNTPLSVQTEYLDGMADDIFSTGKYILLAKHHNLFKEMTLVHEAAHTLGLFHSFQEITADNGRQVNPEHTFEYSTTENIMDYSANTSSFWKYQWDKMRLDNNDLELIP